MWFDGPWKSTRVHQFTWGFGSIKTHEVLKGEKLDLGPSNHMRWWKIGKIWLGPSNHMSAKLCWARSKEFVPRGGPPFLGWCWWILEADSHFKYWGCMLMNSRGGSPLDAVCWWILEANPLLGGCMLMNSKGGPLFGWWILEADSFFWLYRQDC